MFRVLSPAYKFSVTVKDPLKQQVTQEMQSGLRDLHKFFKPLDGKTGCDEAMAAVKAALSAAGIEAEVWLDQFSHN